MEIKNNVNCFFWNISLWDKDSGHWFDFEKLCVRCWLTGFLVNFVWRNVYPKTDLDAKSLAERSFFAFIKKSRHGRDISLFKLLLIVVAGVPLPSEFGGTCNGRSSMSEIRRIIRDTKVLLDIVKAPVDFSATSHKPQ